MAAAPRSTQFAPLETWHNGIHYRSRTEARWAVFFERAGIVARYEMQGYVLDNGRPYLCDFYIGAGVRGEADGKAAQRDAHLEIKGSEPSDDEVLKALALARGTGKCVYLLWGDVAAPEHVTESARLVTPTGAIEDYYAFTECPGCKRIDMAYDGRADMLPCRCIAGYTPGAHTPRLLAAYKAARGARFDNKP